MVVWAMAVVGICAAVRADEPGATAIMLDTVTVLGKQQDTQLLPGSVSLVTAKINSWA